MDTNEQNKNIPDWVTPGTLFVLEGKAYFITKAGHPEGMIVSTGGFFPVSMEEYEEKRALYSCLN